MLRDFNERRVAGVQSEVEKAEAKQREINSLMGELNSNKGSFEHLRNYLLQRNQWARIMNELNRLISDDEDALMQIYVTRKHIVFLIGELTFFSRLVDGEYIDFNRIIVTSHRISVKADKRELVSALERAALVTEERIAGSVRSHVKLEAVGELLKISAVSSAGSTYDELSIDHTGDDILIAFNNRYLIDSIRSCSEEKLTLSMSSPLTSMNIEPSEERKEGEEEIFMLLPVRMKD